MLALVACVVSGPHSLQHRRGPAPAALRARRGGCDDFDRFDLVLAMDQFNCAFLARLCPPSRSRKLKPMMEYSRNYTAREVPDPYDGGPDDFALVLEMLEDATEGLLQTLLSPQMVKR